MNRNHAATLSAAAIFCAAGAALGAPRDVQFRGINLATGVIEMHNFGLSDEPLDGWRFCTQDTTETLRYSSSTGLNGVTIEAGTSIYIHFNNDAPGGDPDRINRSSLGGFFATPLTSPAYSLAIYFPPAIFGLGTQMADFVQWSLGGSNDLTADERTDEAVSGGVWTAMTDWVPTTNASNNYIRLIDLTGGELHSSTDYGVEASMPDCNSNGLDDVFEIVDGTAADTNMNFIPDECENPACSPADITTTGAGSGDPGFGVPDGEVTTADLQFYVNAFVAMDASIADYTTTGAGPGDPGFGVPDGNVSAADIQFYINLWVQGCP